jgi:hypothetical protein
MAVDWLEMMQRLAAGARAKVAEPAIYCPYISPMRQYGIDAGLTYDRHFEQANFKALLR